MTMVTSWGRCRWVVRSEISLPPARAAFFPVFLFDPQLSLPRTLPPRPPPAHLIRLDAPALLLAACTLPASPFALP